MTIKPTYSLESEEEDEDDDDAGRGRFLGGLYEREISMINI